MTAHPLPFRLLAVALLTVCFAMTAFGLASLVLPGNDQLPDRPNVLDVLMFSLIFLTFPSVGLTVAWMRPNHPIGWLLLIVGFSLAFAIFATEYSGRVAFAGENLPGATFVAWVGGWIWLVGLGIALPLAIILFPDGRLPGPRWRPVVIVAVAVVGLLIVAIAIKPGTMEGYGGRFTNPILVGEPLGALASAVAGPGTDLLFGMAVLAMAVLAITSLVVRFRGSRGSERQQLKLFLYPVAVFVLGIAITTVTGESAAWTAALLGLGGVAVATGIAILRHRLFDIDVVIRRTLVYGALVAVLGGVYVALVLGLQAVLSGLTGGDTLPVALSTLVIAAMFGRVRARVRATVDRRFYRSRYDAQRTVEAFSSRLRDEVELEAVGIAFTDAAHRSVRPASIGLWVRGRG